MLLDMLKTNDTTIKECQMEYMKSLSTVGVVKKTQRMFYNTYQIVLYPLLNIYILQSVTISIILVDIYKYDVLYIPASLLQKNGLLYFLWFQIS